MRRLAVLCTIAVLSGVAVPEANAGGSSAPPLFGLAAMMRLGLGEQHGCAIVGAETVQCWGSNRLGQLGLGTSATQSHVGDDETPATAGTVNLGGGASQISAGTYHTCAILQVGTIRCWGYGASGALGRPDLATIGDDETPASVPALDLGTPPIAVAAGLEHTCALVVSGAVRCWGANNFGQLGYGNTVAVTDATLATDVPLGDAAVAISAGYYSTCAVLQSGNVRCWGDNSGGQLGIGDITGAEIAIGDGELPSSVPVVDLAGDIVQNVSIGWRHACAVVVGGAVRCWGDATLGALGYGNLNSIGDNEAPSTVGPVDVGGFVRAVTTGLGTTCALLATNAVRCWGDGFYGGTGTGSAATIGDNEVPSTSPTVNLGPGRVAVAVQTSVQATCAVLDTGDVRCWGINDHVQAGYANPHPAVGDDELPTEVPAIDFGGLLVSRVDAGTYHACAIAGATVSCWGTGYLGQLGYGNTANIGDNESPDEVTPVDVGGTPTAIGAGGNFSCAILTIGVTAGQVRCWGYNDNGELGYGNTTIIGDDEAPSSAGPVNLGSGAVVSEIATGFTHTCALLDNGSVYCWGNNGSGQLGLGHIASIGDNEAVFPAGLVNLGTTATAIAAGESHTCAVLTGGAVRCWGLNNWGQLGLGNATMIGDDEVPTTNVSLGGGEVAVDVTAGDMHTCAILTTGALRCWGRDTFQQLGIPGTDGAVGDNELPSAHPVVDFGGPTVNFVDAGSGLTCAILSNNTMRCWGLNSYGQTGYGTSLNPVGPPSTLGAIAIGGTPGSMGVGQELACAIVAGAARCWGRNDNGKLGLGQSELAIGDDESVASLGPISLSGPVNTPPVALAGADQTLTLATGQSTVAAALNGFGIDYDGLPLTLVWTGTPDPDDTSTPVVSLPAGTHTFTLAVTDAAGENASDSVAVTVNAAPVEPPPAPPPTPAPPPPAGSLFPFTCPDPAPATPFTDIGGSFAAAQIACLYAAAVVSGTSATTYSPTDVVARDQMAVFLMRAYETAKGGEYDGPTTHPFTDVAGNFAEARIGALVNLGITAGTSATTYGPTVPVTREQMAVFLIRLYTVLTGVEPAVPATNPFTDIAGSFAEVQIQQLVGLGITAGTSATTYSPAAVVTREQMAVFVVNLLISATT